MNMNDQEILEDFAITRNLKKRTKRMYKLSIRLYTEINNMSLEELLNEAEREEDEGIRWKRRQLKNRLLRYRVYLYENFHESTAKSRFSQIKAVYRHYEIEIHDLPPMSTKNVLKAEPISYDDLPTKEIIAKALQMSSPLMRAIILFMSSSGCARRETLNMTIGDFLNATYDYHYTDDLFNAISIMLELDDIIPSWKLKRQKTNKYYTTYSSPESTLSIMTYLMNSKRPLEPEEKLFKINPKYLNDEFVKINDTLNLGYAGTFRRFRTHTLRKFHASQLYNDGLSLDYIDSLQGRSKNSTHESYFMENPEKIRELYIDHLSAITINYEIKKLDVKSKEFRELENTFDNLKTKFDSLDERIDRIELNNINNISMFTPEPRKNRMWSYTKP